MHSIVGQIDQVAEHEFVVGRKGLNPFAPSDDKVGRMTEEHVRALLPQTSCQMDTTVAQNLSFVLKGKAESEIVSAILMGG